MLNTRQLKVSISTRHNGSASAARARLLNDPQLRHNRRRAGAPSPLPALPITATYAPPLFDPPADLPSDHSAVLSPAEQRTQALAVAQSFKQHYLAEIFHLADRNITVGLIKPTDVHKSRGDPPYQIIVDADGNVSVSDLDDTPGVLRNARRTAAATLAWTASVVLLLLTLLVGLSVLP